MVASRIADLRWLAIVAFFLSATLAAATASPSPVYLWQYTPPSALAFSGGGAFPRTSDNPLSTFRRTSRVEPAELCRRFAMGGVILSPWQRSEVNPSEFECISELLPFEGADQEATTVFISIRGHSKHQINTIRIRFNVVDPITALSAQVFVIRLLHKFYTSLSWPLSPRIISALKRFEPLRDVSGGISTTFTAVAGDTSRYDLIMRLPEIADILPAGILSPR